MNYVIFIFGFITGLFACAFLLGVRDSYKREKEMMK